jgi:hypothetical protein
MNSLEGYAASIFTLKMEAAWLSKTLVYYHISAVSKPRRPQNESSLPWKLEASH